MKTVHIKNYVNILPGNAVTLADVEKMKGLLKELYDHTLKEDPLFHFFFEPEIIIRIDSEACLNKVKDFLSQRNIEFEGYDYPFPPPGKFGEEQNGIVAKNLNLFLPVLHASSVAAITMNDSDHFQYLERLIHTAFNPKFLSHEVEGKVLTRLAMFKLGKQGLLKVLESENQQ